MRPILIDAHNPSPMTGRGNNTYLLVAANDSVLIDAGVGHPAHLAELDRQLVDHAAELRRVLVTHGHGDHASGAPALAAVYPQASFEKYPWPDEDRRHAVAWHQLKAADTIAAGAEKLAVLHTPGHSPDHLAFWHEPSSTIFTGDLVVAGGSVMIHASRGGSLAEYLASLRRVLALRPRTLLPAHGPQPDDPQALLSSYIEHRLMREEQVIAALRAGRATVQAIAEYIYDDLDPALLGAARENVRAHLEKLDAEGRAVDEDDRWRLCG